jgi:hypothetical protein
VYVPYRRYSQRYVERVNVHNTVIVNRTIIRNVYENGHTNMTYRNRGVPGGVTAVSRSTFTSAERVGDRRIRDERQFAGRGATAVAPRIDPVRESRLGSGDTRRFVRSPPQAVIARQVVVKRNPPPSAGQFTRSVGQREARREQPDRVNRGPDRPSGNDWGNRSRPDNSGAGPTAESGRVQDSRPAANDRGVRDGRTPYRQRTDRPERANQPRTEVVAPQTLQSQPEQQRPVAVRQQEYRQREQSERQQQGRELQERRRSEVQAREPREQQSVRERPPVRVQQNEQPRAVPRQAQPREQRERPEPQKPTAPQRQRDDNDDRGRPQRNDSR